MQTDNIVRYVSLQERIKISRIAAREMGFYGDDLDKHIAFSVLDWFAEKIKFETELPLKEDKNKWFNVSEDKT
jgi:hypothetical protein